MFCTWKLQDQVCKVPITGSNQVWWGKPAPDYKTWFHERKTKSVHRCASPQPKKVSVIDFKSRDASASKRYSYEDRRGILEMRIWVKCGLMYLYLPGQGLAPEWRTVLHQPSQALGIATCLLGIAYCRIFNICNVLHHDYYGLSLAIVYCKMFNIWSMWLYSSKVPRIH